MEPKVARYRVAEHRLEETKNHIAKLNKRALKLGVTPITLTVGAYKDVPYKRSESGQLVELTADDVAHMKARGYNNYKYIRIFDVELAGGTPKLAGWTFVATLEHLQADTGPMNLLRTVPWFKESLPEEYRTASPENCDHCQVQIRTRKETFIVRHEDGTWKQVGRNCTRDFLGGKDPHAILKEMELLQAAAELLADEQDRMEWPEGWFSVDGRHDLEHFLVYVAACIRVDGWMSRGKARDSNGQISATADDALALLVPPREKNESYRQFAEERAPAPEDWDVVQKTIEYVREKFENDNVNGRALSDYEYNLHVVAKQPLITWKMTGIAASMVPYYLREVERQVLRERELRRVADSKHLGEVGERRLFNVQVSAVITVGEMSQFGPSHLHKMITPEGDLLIWFASDSAERLKPGETYTIKATVKKHDERNGVKQTVVSRVTSLTPEMIAAEERKAARAAKKAAAAR